MGEKEKEKVNLDLEYDKIEITSQLVHSRQFTLDEIESLAQILACDKNYCGVRLRAPMKKVIAARKVTGIQPRLTVAEYLPGQVRRIARIHKLSEDTVQDIKATVRTILRETDKPMTMGQIRGTPSCISASILYIACATSGHHIPQLDISNALNVTEATIRKGVNRLYDHLNRTTIDDLYKNVYMKTRKNVLRQVPYKKPSHYKKLCPRCRKPIRIGDGGFVWNPNIPENVAYHPSDYDPERVLVHKGCKEHTLENWDIIFYGEEAT